MGCIMTFVQKQENYIKEVVNNLGYKLDGVILEKCNIRELGDFQINFAMKLAKEYGKNPRDIAAQIVEQLDGRFTNVNIAGPGFINLTISDEYLLDYANNEALDFKNNIDEVNDKTIIVDYGGANAAKALHVGHMRSPNIGEAMKRLCKLYNKTVIGDVHLGDLGRQAGMLISEYKEMHPDSPYFDKNFKGEYPKIDLTVDDLGIMYPRANLKAKNDENKMAEVREITAEIDKGNKAYIELWSQMVELSKVKIKEIYDKLNCTFELWNGELGSMEFVPDTMKILTPYLYPSDGALIMDVKEDDDKVEIPPLIVIKQDGATIYATRDLATIYERMKNYNPDEIWYFTDERQSMYFTQVFRAAHKSGLVNDNTILKHFGFGTVNGPDGKPFKTRDGGVMDLATLILNLKVEVDKKIKDTITGKEREEILDKLTIAALKYTDLLPYRKTDYIFDPVKFSSLDGKTGPYILYTVVRIKSILNKANMNDVKMELISNSDIKDILLKFIELPKILKLSYNDATLSYISEYIYDLCNLFNKFYNNHNILNEKDNVIKNSYIALCQLTYSVLHNLLDILAIEEVDKM